jgi:ABC-type lipoprotein release transport system permease subunit
VSSTDPWTMISVPSLLIVAGLTACLIPAWRAASVDPAEVLRES